MAMTKLTTADDLFLMGEEDGRFELIRGELYPMTPTGGEHGEVGHEIDLEIGLHVREHGLGRVYSAETGFILFPDRDTVLVPDIAFVRADRLPPKRERIKFLALAPDLVVEVISPSDRMTEIQNKVQLYLDAGVRLIWLVEPRHQRVTVYAQNRDSRVLGEGDELEGEDVLPGFRLAVAAIFR